MKTVPCNAGSCFAVQGYARRCAVGSGWVIQRLAISGNAIHCKEEPPTLIGGRLAILLGSAVCGSARISSSGLGRVAWRVAWSGIVLQSKGPVSPKREAGHRSPPSRGAATDSAARRARACSGVVRLCEVLQSKGPSSCESGGGHRSQVTHRSVSSRIAGLCRASLGAVRYRSVEQSKGSVPCDSGTEHPREVGRVAQGHGFPASGLALQSTGSLSGETAGERLSWHGPVGLRGALHGIVTRSNPRPRRRGAQ